MFAVHAPAGLRGVRGPARRRLQGLQGAVCARQRDLPRLGRAEGRLLEQDGAEAEGAVRRQGRAVGGGQGGREGGPGGGTEPDQGEGQVRQDRQQAGREEGQGRQQGVEGVRLGGLARKQTAGKRSQTSRPQAGEEGGQGRRQGRQGAQKGKRGFLNAANSLSATTTREESPRREEQGPLRLLRRARGALRPPLPRHVPHPGTHLYAPKPLLKNKPVAPEEPQQSSAIKISTCRDQRGSFCAINYPCSFLTFSFPHYRLKQRLTLTP